MRRALALATLVFGIAPASSQPDGALRFRECFQDVGYGPTACTPGRHIIGPTAVEISHDGRNLYVTSVGGLVPGVAVFTIDRRVGALSQLPGARGCVSQTGASSDGGLCATEARLIQPAALAESPDGRHVYVVSANPSSTIVTLARDRLSGGLSVVPGSHGCVSARERPDCVRVRAITRATAIAASPDGRHVYVTASDDDAVAVFTRDPRTGKLTQLGGDDGCVSADGTDGDGGVCGKGGGIDDPTALAVSADGRNVYAAGGLSDAVAIFARDGRDGALRQLAGVAGCLSASSSRTGTQCGVARGILYPSSVTVSPDGRNVYLASWGGLIAAFGRDRRTGALRQLPGTAGCLVDPGWSIQGCAPARLLPRPTAIAVSPDGRNVYVSTDGASAASPPSKGVAVFARSPSGALLQLPGENGCASDDGSDGYAGACASVPPLALAVYDLTVSPDGKSVYVLADALAAFARRGSDPVPKLPLLRPSR